MRPGDRVAVGTDDEDLDPIRFVVMWLRRRRKVDLDPVKEILLSGASCPQGMV